jgi:acyl dehydratase
VSAPSATTSGPRYVDVEIGETMKPFKVALTPQRLVMEAGANRDFLPIHIDPEAARRSGAPTAYANTTLIETVLEAAVRLWAGPAARIRMLEFTMSDFTCAGETISTEGRVLAKRTEGGSSLIDLELGLYGDVRGVTVSGRATVSFPST